MTQNPAATSDGESLPAPVVPQSPAGLTWWSAGLIAIGFAPPLLEFFSNIWRMPQYQFFPGALAAAGFLAWDRLKEVPRPLNAGQPWVTAPLLLLSFATLSVAVLLWSPWVGAIAALVCLAGMLWWLGGWALTKRMAPAMIMLVTIIPLPLGLDGRFTLFLRRVATTASSRLLDMLGVVHTVTGNVIELPGHQMLVEEACSGINSVLVISAFTLFYLFWCRRSFLCYLICLPAALGFVFIGNVIRITLGAWLQFRTGIDLLSGWKHEALGLVLVAVYIGLVMSLEHFLYWPPADETIRRPRRRSKKRRSAAPPPPPRPRLRIAPAWGWAAGIIFGIMGLAGAARCYSFHQESRIQQPFSNRSALAPDARFDLPKQIGPWTRLTSGKPVMKRLETVGLSSLIWEFTNRSNMVAGVAFDYPIWGYHDVTLCYLNNGWNITQRRRIANEGKTPPWLEMEMKNDTEAHGALWVATINENGQWMEEVEVKRSFLDRLRNPGTPQPTSYRIQLLIINPFPLSAEERSEAARLFQAAREMLAQELLGQVNPRITPVP